MSLRSLVNSNSFLRAFKPILKPVTEAIWGKTGIESWLDLIAKVEQNAKGVILDVGAADGLFLRKAAKVFPKSTYFAFEPRKEMEATLAEVIRRLGINASIYSMALSDGSGSAEMAIMSHGDASSLVIDTRGTHSDIVDTITVVTTTLDDFSKERDFCGEVEILKVDVEGFERNVLKGAGSTLARVRNLILEISPLRHVSRNETIEILEMIFASGMNLVDSSEMNFFFTRDLQVLHHFGYRGNE